MKAIAPFPMERQVRIVSAAAILTETPLPEPHQEISKMQGILSVFNTMTPEGKRWVRERLAAS